MQDKISNNKNNIKGFEGEKNFKKWAQNEPLLKNLKNIKKTKSGKKGVDFEAFAGNNKIAIQIKNQDSVINSSKLYTFLQILDQYNGGIFINFGKGKLTNEVKKLLKKKKVNIIVPNLMYKKIPYDRNYVLYPHQKEAVEAAILHYKKNNRGLLNMACGTGKTFVSKHII
ncbi:MAG: DEAD/DEAH box helicase family protein [Candidatus Phytoplasma pyri]